MSNENNRMDFEQQIRFVAQHYREDALDVDEAWRKFANAHAVRRSIPLRRYVLQMAAAILLLVGVGLWFLQEQKSPDWVAITTAPGQLKDVYLPDSTYVALAGDSWIRYDAKQYNKEKRAVQMRGKAFFKVTRNEASPFSAQSKETIVTVLGTSFQLVEQEGCTSLDVESGKVRFAAGTIEETVTAGMSAEYRDQRISLLKVTPDNRWAWRTGQLQFKNTPLKEVIHALSDHYGVEIKNLVNKENAKLTATFTRLPLEEVLTIVNQTLDVQLVAQKEKHDGIVK